MKLDYIYVRMMRILQIKYLNGIGKHGKIDPVGTDEIDPVKTA